MLEYRQIDKQKIETANASAPDVIVEKKKVDPFGGAKPVDTASTTVGAQILNAQPLYPLRLTILTRMGFAGTEHYSYANEFVWSPNLTFTVLYRCLCQPM